jgi:hypothetical protein
MRGECADTTLCTLGRSRREHAPSSHRFITGTQGEFIMVETVQVGQEVSDFTLDTYNPQTGDFDEVSLAKNKKAGKWTLLFFYPADFTFV